MIDVLKFIGAPGSIPFLVVATILGATLVRFTRRFRRTGIAWLAAVIVAYIVLAVPVVANGIAEALPDVNAVETADVHPATRVPVETVVVIDGDNRRGRVRELQRILRDQRPSTVWVLGGRWILEALQDAGISGPAFRYDATAVTTRAQLDQVATIARFAPNGATAVIASRLQAPRVAALIQRRGLRVSIVPAAIDSEPPTFGPARYVPSYIGLRASRDAIYEHAALVYYRWRGWIE